MKSKAIKLFHLFIVFTLLISSFCFFSNETYAGSPVKKIIKGKTTINLSNRYNIIKKEWETYFEDYDDEDLELEYDGQKPNIKEFYKEDFDPDLYYGYGSWPEDCSWNEVTSSSKSFSFTTKRKMCFIVPIRIEVFADGELKKGEGVRVKLKNKQGKVIQNDFINLKGYCIDENDEPGVYISWLYSDGFLQPAGNYTYTFSTNIKYPEDSIRIKYSIIGYTQFAKTAKMKKIVSKKSGSWVKLGKLGVGTPITKSVYSSNKGVVPYIDIDENGNVYVYCRKKGISNIKLKLKNGKKYKTKVVVKAGDPNFTAYLTGYNTRNNFFTIKVHNDGASPVTFVRYGSKVIDKDYKKYDRYIRNGNSVTVKPGKSQNINYYVSGSNTWHDYGDFTLYTSIRYEGKTYPCHIWVEDSSYNRNNKWWTTYWAND